MQLIGLFQNLLAVSKTHNSSKQPTNLNILLLCISMWKLNRITLYEVCTMILSCPFQELQFSFFGHLWKFVFHFKCKDTELIETPDQFLFLFSLFLEYPMVSSINIKQQSIIHDILLLWLQLFALCKKSILTTH